MQYLLDEVRKKSPIVHCITNYITANDCANMVLAAGGSPIMADAPEEAADITAISQSLVINIGSLNMRTIPAMVEAGKAANRLHKPVILDPVGNGASPLRTDTTNMLLREIKFSVIRGNMSEIKMIALGMANTQGVDAAASDAIKEDNLQDNIALAKNLAQKTGAIIAITGAIDIIANEKHAYVIRNGHSMMSKITGTGCMCSVLIGSLCGANDDYWQATSFAVSLMGLAGEIGYQRMAKLALGNSSMRNFLIDAVCNMDQATFDGGQKIEMV